TTVVVTVDTSTPGPSKTGARARPPAGPLPGKLAPAGCLMDATASFSGAIPAPVTTMSCPSEIDETATEKPGAAAGRSASYAKPPPAPHATMAAAIATIAAVRPIDFPI